MGEKEDKERAEKLAAAKKKVAQLRKTKKKASEAPTADKTSKPKTKDDSTVESEKPAEETEPLTDVGEEQIDTGLNIDGDETALQDAISAAKAECITDDVPVSSPSESVNVSKTKSHTRDRQTSLSIQSKMRSDSFRKSSTNGPASPSILGSGLPSMSPDGTTMNDIYRKQAVRLEELERENKRLEKDTQDGEARWRRSEEELEELREASGEASALKAQARKAEQAQSEIAQLRAEITALQRQAQQRDHTRSFSKSIRPGAVESGGSPDNLRKELESKDSIISDMEFEISKLRGELSTKTSSCETHGSQILALQQSLDSTRKRQTSTESELADAKKALARASEKAVKEGVEKTSHSTKIKSLERDLADQSAAHTETTRKATNLEKKIETMNKLHRETEARNSSKLSAAESQGREAARLKAQLATAENENARLREERNRRKRHEAAGADDEGMDELEDEERLRLERRVRELEGEVFDLRRGVFQEKRKEIQPDSDTRGQDEAAENYAEDVGDFDEVDLSGGAGPPGGNSRSRALTDQKHSSFSTVLNSGLAAFRGSPEHPSSARPRQDSLLQELDDEDDEEDLFDEEAFALAQREEEMKKMVEHVKEVKRKLRDWEGFRLDLVESRRNIAGVSGGAVGEIFEV